MERQLYSQVFGIPPECFDVIPWGYSPTAIATPAPAEAGGDVCAIGGNARDYRTLFEVATRLPQIRSVVVPRPADVRGLSVPSNVAAKVNIPFDAAMNILQYSRFIVLPLIGTEVPCGHVTIVCALQLGKAYVITDSAGIRDYAKDQVNALTVKYGSVVELSAAIVRLWSDPGYVRS